MQQRQSDAPRVLVTGATGFLGSHCVWLLLQCGFYVRGTTRNVNSPKAGELLSLVALLQLPAGSFELVACDEMGNGSGWSSAADGCTHCIHTACPSGRYEMDDPSSIVMPAVIGTRALLTVRGLASFPRNRCRSNLQSPPTNHLQACYQHDIESVVMTSCISAGMSCFLSHVHVLLHSTCPCRAVQPQLGANATLHT